MAEDRTMVTRLAARLLRPLQSGVRYKHWIVKITMTCNDRIMSKVYWLQDLCRLNPFNTKYFMWVDCGVCTTYLAADMMDFLGRRYEAMMEPGYEKHILNKTKVGHRFLATNSPRDGGDEIQGFMRWKLEEYAGKHTTHIMKVRSPHRDRH